MKRLEGKTAVITGAARGIGAAIAQAFAADGAAVVVSDVLEAEGQALADGLGSKARFHRLDVTSGPGWQAVLESAEQDFGQVSILVNNAGILAYGTIEDQQPEEFRRVLDVNLFGAWLGIHTAAPFLRRAGGGVVVNISSTAGLMGYANLGAYTASKWGLRGLTKVAALELAADGVRVCSIHPGPIATPMTAGMDSSVFAGQPIARFGTAEEVARLALFIVADATYSTGSEFIVDGGATTGSMIVADAGE